MDYKIILEDVYSLTDEIKETKEYKRLKSSYDALMNNDETIKLIEEFNKDKNNYNENNDESIKRLSKSKKALYTHPLYIEYSNALIEYNNMINEIESKINKAIYKDNVRELSKSGCKND